MVAPFPSESIHVAHGTWSVACLGPMGVRGSRVPCHLPYLTSEPPDPQFHLPVEMAPWVGQRLLKVTLSKMKLVTQMALWSPVFTCLLALCLMGGSTPSLSFGWCVWDPSHSGLVR
jgi:hypothetical protein